jgi:hypothetical protein
MRPTFRRPAPTNGAGTEPSSFSPIFEGSNSHGFLRSREGTFTTFDGAGAAFTLATSINPTGAITGSYFDASTVQHGFLRSDDGTFTTFNGPGSIFTFPASINPAGGDHRITNYRRRCHNNAPCAAVTYCCCP